MSNPVMDLLKKDNPDVTLRQVESIGPQVGEGGHQWFDGIGLRGGRYYYLLVHAF